LWELIPATAQKFQGKHAFVLKSLNGKVMDVEGSLAKN